MRVLVGYAMRSGSTLLAHVLGGHSRVRAYGDLSSILSVPRLLRQPEQTLVVKPPDLVYLAGGLPLHRYFDRAVWLTRDPRDSYLSAVESGYAYLFRRPGLREHGIDTGLLERWARIHRCYFEDPDRWYLVRYEDLATRPADTLRRLQAHLGLPEEKLVPFRWRRRDLMRGGDYKIAHTRDVSPRGIGRYRGVMGPRQRAVFAAHLGPQIRALGYRSD